jgi:hypothetical protein
VSAVFDDAQPPAAQPVRRPMALRGAKVREGDRGDWSVVVWFRNEAEAVEIATMLNERLGRKPQDGVETP